jgi:class 3 adenylate cyclase
MVYRFHDFILDAARRELRQGGHLIALEPKVLQVLFYLLSHRDRVIPKAELLDQCWPGTFVTESALARCLTRLRNALQGDGMALPVIKTLHRQGYRFVAEVAESPHDTPLSPIPVPTAQPANASVQPASQQNPAVTSVPPSHATERRQLTVMFCDVVDSTPLAGQLDPEDFRDVMLRYQMTCADVIQRYDGHIAQYLGDGLLVYFGYPRAHEDAARRAVHAGLEILTAIADLGHQLAQEYRIRVALRIGIHTGLVVIGEMAGGSQHGSLALGAPPNLAAKLQGLAAPHSLLISAATHHLVQGYFACQLLGKHMFPGMTEPMPLYHVLHPSGAQGRLDVVTTRGLTPFVGRDREVSALLRCWQHVRNGSGHVVMLSGEVGIGKSRLLQALTDHMAYEPHTVLECRCSPYYHQSPWYPISELFRHLLNWPQHTTSDEKVDALERYLAQAHLDLTEAVPLLATLLALPLPAERYAPLALSPQEQRHKVLEVLLRYVTVLAEQQPLLLIVEDLHWCDPSTLEWLTCLIDQGPTVPLLLCLTCRPTFQPPWGWRAHVTPLIVDHLSAAQIASMVQHLTGGKLLPPTLMQHIATTTGGVPLFIEEMTRMFLESDVLVETDGQYALRTPLSTLAIPHTLQDLLMARLDPLGAAKRTVQLGAVLGRQFSYELLAARVTLSARAAAAGDICISPCADSGNSLPVAPQAHSATPSCPDCAAAHYAVS